MTVETNGNGHHSKSPDELAETLRDGHIHALASADRTLCWRKIDGLKVAAAGHPNVTCDRCRALIPEVA